MLFSKYIHIFATYFKQLLKPRFKMKTKNSNKNQYTSKFINANFRIKAFGLNAIGKKINTLVGVSGAINLIGSAEMLYKFITRAIKAGLDKCVCKLRRGLVITLYVK